jgi:Spy/CpxP family protein refolding chaperone
MRYISWVMVLAWLAGNAACCVGQDKTTNTSNTAAKDNAPAKDEPKTKLKGTLPANFGKLNLSDSQKQQIYRLQAKYAEQIEALEKQIEKIRAERNESYRNVLTKAQRDRLDEIRRGTKEEPKDK